MSIPRKLLATTKFGAVATGKRLGAIHPGAVLLDDFINPLGLTRYRVAKAIGVPQRRIDEICLGSRAVSADTALRLARFFSVDPQFWMNLQAQYDLEIAEAALDAEIVPLGRAA